MQQWDTTTHLLEWIKSKTLPTPNADEDMEQQELLLVAMQNGTATLEDSLAVSYKAKYSLKMWFNDHAPCSSNELKSYIHTKTCAEMFIAALFIIANT